MNLYEIQDDDRPMYVVAKDWQGALEAWTDQIRFENPELDQEEAITPEGIRHVCDGRDLILPTEKRTVPTMIGNRQGNPPAMSDEKPWIRTLRKLLQGGRGSFPRQNQRKHLKFGGERSMEKATGRRKSPGTPGMLRLENGGTRRWRPPASPAGSVTGRG